MALILRSAVIYYKHIPCMQRTPEEWPQNPDYTFMYEIARDMLVVNGCAERNIIRPLQTKYASHGMSMDC